MARYHEKLLDLLHDILKKQPGGISEYDLLHLLKAENLPFFADHETIDTLALFKNHFLLFHLLYLLRDRLYEQEKGYLEIHCLKIILHPWAQRPEELPGRPDNLRDYYRDLKEMKGMDQSDVDKLLAQFWERYLRHDKRPASLKTLGLDLNASRVQIKQRFRELARRHHPDRGGDPEKFRQINEAAEILLSHERFPLPTSCD